MSNERMDLDLPEASLALGPNTAVIIGEFAEKTEGQ
jgi:hypothetical protein